MPCSAARSARSCRPSWPPPDTHIDAGTTVRDAYTPVATFPSGVARVASVSPMAGLMEAARRRNPLPTGTLAVGAGLLVSGLSAYGFFPLARPPPSEGQV